jgi:hypothetical protein
MFIGLRDGQFDESGPSEIPAEHTATIPVAEAMGSDAASSAGSSAKAGAARKDAGRKPEPPEPPRPPPLYQGTLAAAGQPALSAAVSLSSGPARQSIFGGDMGSEKSLDEVILSYLATDDKDA